MPEYSAFKNLKCEIQLTTAMWHAWSEPEHDLIYKNEEKLKEINNRAYNSMRAALKELKVKYIDKAVFKFNAIYAHYEEIIAGKSVLDIDYFKKLSQHNLNNEIFNKLEFVEKKINLGNAFIGDLELIEDFNKIIEQSKKNKIEDIETPLGRIAGKTVFDIVDKILTILEGIKLRIFPESLYFLVGLYNDQQHISHDKIIKILGDLAKYNYNVLKQIGYGVQSKILGIIEKWTSEERKRSVQLIKIMAREMLKPSFSGYDMVDYKTINMKGGTLRVNDNLKKIRRTAIGLVFELYASENSLNEKIRLLKIVEEASQFPMSSLYEKDFEEMVYADVRFIIAKYEKILLDKENIICADQPIVQEIKRQLDWFLRRHKDCVNEARDLLQKIKEDNFSELFRLFVGDRIDWMKDGNWEEGEKNRKKLIDNKFKDINEDNLVQWAMLLNEIAKYRENIEDWQFMEFKKFLERIAMEKVELADKILSDAFDKDEPIKNYVGVFLGGFREINNIDLWDKYKIKVIETQDTDLLTQLLNSFWYVKNEFIEKYIRGIDIDLLENIVDKENEFEFLKNKEENRNLRFKLIQALLYVYNKDKDRLEKLIIREMKNNPSQDYLNIYLGQIEFTGSIKTSNILNFSEKGIDFILDKLVEVRNLDYNEQNLLFTIGQKYFSKMMDVFKRRIIKNREEWKGRKGLLDSPSYCAIPYSFNDELRKLTREHKDYKDIIEGWIMSEDFDESVMLMEIGRFINEAGISIDDILIKIIEAKDKKNIEKIIDLIRGVSEPDFDICFKIIENISDKDIWREVESMMHSTGVVSGEDGLVRAFKGKLKKMEEYEKKYEFNEQVLEFIRKAKENLVDQIAFEQQRMEEDIALRKMEYGG